MKTEAQDSNRLIFNDRKKEKELFVPIKNITSCFAKWAIQQSPYKVPENLEIAILKFHARLEELFSEHLTLGDAWLNLRITEENWSRMISSIIINKTFAEVYNWNERKNGNKRNFNAVGLFSKLDPDDDFIDLHALSRNIEMEIWREYSSPLQKKYNLLEESKK